jgi:hypothetical protein
MHLDMAGRSWHDIQHTSHVCWGQKMIDLLTASDCCRATGGPPCTPASNRRPGSVGIKRRLLRTSGDGQTNVASVCTISTLLAKRLSNLILQ